MSKQVKKSKNTQTSQATRAATRSALEISGVDVPLIFDGNSELPVVILKLVFMRAGRAYDEVPGTARIFARLLNEGVDEDFFRQLEFHAISLEASSDFEGLALVLSCLREHFDRGLAALAQLLASPRFEEKILKRLKITAAGELASKKSDYDYLAKNMLNAQFFGREEFESPNDGDEASIARVSMRDLKKFHSQKLVLNRLILILGGDIAEDEARAKLASTLATLPAGEAGEAKHFEPALKFKDELALKEQSLQAYIYFASPLAVRLSDPNSHLAKIMLFILGQGGFGSRVMEEVRVKRGLAYSAYAMLDLALSYSRVFGYLQTKNESAVEAKKIVREVFENFISGGATQAELDQAKNFITGSLPLRYESLNHRLMVAAQELYFGLEPGHLKREAARVREVGLAELNAYIKSHDEILQLSFASIVNKK